MSIFTQEHMQDPDEEYEICVLPNTQSSDISADASQSQAQSSQVIELSSVNISFEAQNYFGYQINCQQNRQHSFNSANNISHSPQRQVAFFRKKQKKQQNSIEDNYQNRLNTITSLAKLMEKAKTQTIKFAQLFKLREEALNNEINSLAKQNQSQDCHIRMCLFFLYYIAYYNYTHHIRALSGQLQLQKKQFLVAQTDKTFLIDQGLIHVNYNNIQYDLQGKQRLINYLYQNYKRFQIQQRLHILFKELKSVFCIIRTQMTDDIRFIIEKMCYEGIEKVYDIITLPIIIKRFDHYLKSRHKSNKYLQNIQRVFFEERITKDI